MVKGLQNALFSWAPKSLQIVTAAIKLKDAPWRKSYDQPRQHIKSRAIPLPTKAHLVKAMVSPWHPTPVLLPGKSHGRRSLVDCSPWGRKESDTTERLRFHFSLSCIGEGNGNPLQCSCLENPRDREAWWAAVYGVAQSWIWLKRLSSSSIYGCDSWSIKKAEHEIIDAFESWFWTRLLRVPWTARRSNQSILQEISPEYSLERLMLKLPFFGHLMQRINS